jgi:hypothetical protein
MEQLAIRDYASVEEDTRFVDVRSALPNDSLGTSSGSQQNKPSTLKYKSSSVSSYASYEVKVLSASEGTQ